MDAIFRFFTYLLNPLTGVHAAGTFRFPLWKANVYQLIMVAIRYNAIGSLCDIIISQDKGG
jgi:hypothetical protein